MTNAIDHKAVAKRAREAVARQHRRRAEPRCEGWKWSHGCVYFVQRQDGGPIKIGYSRDITANSRVNSLQRQYGCALMVLARLPGSLERERLIHGQFHKHALGNEWFVPAEEILAFIRNVNSEGELSE